MKDGFEFYPRSEWFIGVAFSQIVRTGKNNGKLITNTGVECDVLVRPTKNDVYGKTYSLTQYERIAESLKSHSRAGLKFDLQPLSAESHLLDNDLSFKAEIAGFQKIEIKIDGQTFSTIDTSSKSTYDFIIAKNALKAGLARIEFFGYDAKGELQFRAIRDVELLAPTSEAAIEKRDYSGISC